MLKDVQWSEDGTYTPQGLHKPLEFFSEGLKNSIRFDLELGYFNSAAISVLSRAFATFIAGGGNMRMAINQMVSAKDKAAISMGQNSEGNLTLPFDLSDMNRLRTTLDEYGDHFFRCLAYLIQEGRIAIRIIKPRGTEGIAHTKKGQFVDAEGQTVSFTGSANFTLGGFFNNLEEIVISHSTSPDYSVQCRIAKQKKDFERLMTGKSETVEYLSAKELEVAIVKTFGGADIKELIDVEKQLKRYKKQEEKATSVAEYERTSLNLPPAFPYESGPREYQIQAFDSWLANKQKGLFAMATGTGKTLTSLNCLLEIYKRKGYYKAIILVPTITLVNQWEEECRKFRFKNIIKVSSANTNWHTELDAIKMKEEFDYASTEPSYIIISTYASFARKTGFPELTEFPKKALKQILLIADECHNMGARRVLDQLEGIRFARRIGLSATPERQFDDTGNRAISSFFGCHEDQYTFEFSMREAIDKGYLCRYYYYPHIVRLADDEMADYMKISKQLVKFFNYDSCSFPGSDDILMALLLKRKRIIHKARGKIDVFRDIVTERFTQRGDLKYTLVYAPEGVRPDGHFRADDFDAQDHLPDDAETDSLIDDFSRVVMELDDRMTVKKFVSGIKNRDEILESFAVGETQVLTSMKCLDEGVDVPRSELAIFCASTGNPRQFIQRRGRILRNHKDKAFAYIHDLVVVPEIGSYEENYEMERRLLDNELKRVRDFAGLSENADFCFSELEDIAAYYSLSLF